MIIQTGFLAPKLAFFSIIFLFVRAFSQDDLLSPEDPGCVLEYLKTSPFRPRGECIGQQQNLKELGSISTTLCCRDVLNVLTEALAWHASTTKSDSIFLPQDQWLNCSGSFHNQTNVSPHSCGFDTLYSGSKACSSFPLSKIRQEGPYQNALDSCSSFSSSSFNDACTKCTDALVAARDNQLSVLGVKGKDFDSETAICGAAVVISVAAAVISVAAAKIEDPLVLDDFYRCLPALDDFGDHDYFKIKYSVLKVVLATVIAAIVFMLVILLIKYVANSKSKNKEFKPPVGRKKEVTTWSGLYTFAKFEIENAINYVNERKSLGRGSAGQVYRGLLPSGQVVAVKHIHKSNTSDSFQREVDGLSRVRHPNLVCLFGCCIEGGEQYLVYEYCSAGNLAQHLLKKGTDLTWDKRVNILRGCTLGLRYLHHYVDGCIVHRDIKLTNILLTENLDPKLSDFGLAKMLGMEESKVFTDVRGTIGYMDPEYMTNAKLTCASDIYSFGIVILQLLSGQKVIELDLDARDQLTRKAKDVIRGKRPLSDLEDPRLNGVVNTADFEAILQIAVLCVAKSSRGRPTIDDIFEVVDKAWKNTDSELRSKREFSTSLASMSRSLESIPV